MSSQEGGGGWGGGGGLDEVASPLLCIKIPPTNIKRTSVLIHINSPSQLSDPFICPPTDFDSCTTLPGLAPDFSMFFLTMHPQLSRWHDDTKPLRCKPRQYACGCTTWAWRSEIKGFDANLPGRHQLKLWKGQLWLTNNASKGFVYDGYLEVNMSVSHTVSSTVLQMSWIYLLTDLLVNTPGASRGWWTQNQVQSCFRSDDWANFFFSSKFQALIHN